MLKGIYAPIPTPFEDGRLSLEHLRHNLAKWEKTRLSGLVVLGSNGEVVLLEEKEKLLLIEKVREQFPADKPVLAGTGAESTQATISLSQQAARLGADGVLVITPSYYKGAMTQPALVRFYTEVADACPVPVVLYNMPRNTGLNLPSAAVIELAKHPNIIGIKDSGGNIVQIAEIIAGTPEDFSVFAGSGSFLFPTLTLGGTGGTLAVANVIPDLCDDIYQLTCQGQYEEARKLQLAILPINGAVTARYGVAGLKAALDLLGYFGGPVRGPLTPLPEAPIEEIKTLLRGVKVLP